MSNKGQNAKLHDGDDDWQVSHNKAAVIPVARNCSEVQRVLRTVIYELEV